MSPEATQRLRLFCPVDKPPTTQPQRVCVLGLGYIGLPTSAVLADVGHQVTGVDVKQEVIDTINRGEVHIVEPGLPDLVRDVVGQGRFCAAAAPVEADVFILCVPTPITDDKTPDLSCVRQAAAAIAPLVRRGCLIILESTSPPSTTMDVVAKTAVPEDLTIGKDVFVAHCPERVIPGRVLHEVKMNDRVVGGLTEACTERAVAFYESFVEGKVVRTRAIVAELTKLVENAYRDVNIAFANELSILAEQFGADPMEIIEIANRHPRVNILQPGPGVGGHCISVDPWFLVHHAPDTAKLIKTARLINDAKPHFVVEKVMQAVAECAAQTVGCLGLAYKADVDDLRESPSLEIVRQLREKCDARIMVCEPYLEAAQFEELVLDDLDSVLRASDVLVLLTDHTQFKQIDPLHLLGKKIIDTRGTWRGRMDVATQRKVA
jgi:UDP-N-acetyl-D-mannosaminuronic acid dehydrogenase